MIEVYKWVKGINKGSIDQVIEISTRAGHGAAMGTSQRSLDSGQTQVDIDSLTQW